MKIRPILQAFCYDRKGRLLSSATNSYHKTHPLQKYFAEKVGSPAKVYLHAEIAAILAARGKPIYKIVITRHNPKTHKPLNAKPCPICAEAIRAFGIELVSYTTGETT